MDQVNKIRENTPEYANKASVALELQADCYAGIWANSIAGLGILEKNEISEAIDAAESV
jgi:predicted metalloprotease